MSEVTGISEPPHAASPRRRRAALPPRSRAPSWSRRRRGSNAAGRAAPLLPAVSSPLACPSQSPGRRAAPDRDRSCRPSRVAGSASRLSARRTCGRENDPEGHACASVCRGVRSRQGVQAGAEGAGLRPRSDAQARGTREGAPARWAERAKLGGEEA